MTGLLCYIITQYWIQSFCKLVFFQLGLVLYFYLDLFHCRPHLFESVFFLVKNWISFE